MSGNSACTILSNKVATGPSIVRRSAPARVRPAERPGLYAANDDRKYLNEAERGRVLTALAKLPEQQALYGLTLAWTGSRPSEVLSLTSASFQIERSVVALRTLKRRRHVMREVPIPPTLMAMLATHFDLAARQQDEALSAEPLWPWCRQTGWRIIKRAMSDAGFIGIAATPRGLRHAFGVGTVQTGVPLSIVQRWLGHARLSTTAIYTDVCGPEEIALAARFWQASFRAASPVERRWRLRWR